MKLTQMDNNMLSLIIFFALTTLVYFLISYIENLRVTEELDDFTAILAFILVVAIALMSVIKFITILDPMGYLK